MPNQDPHIAQELLAHQTFLRRLALDLVGKDADDLVQDVWQRALERPPHHGRQLRGWLARVARNLAANRWRGEARRTEREERRASERPVGDEFEARFELRKELVEALDSLSQPCRETILLRYFEGLAPRDIARRQGTTEATVKTRLRRGLAQLRAALDERYGDDRATWMSAVAALAAPVGSDVGTGTLVIGGMAVGTMMKVSAAVFVAAACVYFEVRTPPTESPRMAAVEPPAADVELVEAADGTAVAVPVMEAVRSPLAGQASVGVPAVTGTNLLRVVLEGITAEDARMATVTLTGQDERGEWPEQIRDSWLCQGLTSEFDLDPFLASVERHGDLRVDELEVEVDHPHHLRETTRVSLSRDVEPKSGQTVHEVRVRLVPAAVIHGRLVREDGTPAAEGLVGALLLEESTWARPTSNGSTLSDVPMEDGGRAVECAADGAFELRMSASGRHALASYEQGRRPTTTLVEALVGTRLDVGTLVLEPGHAITGQALRHGNPLAAASISLTQPRVFWAADPADVEKGMNAWIPGWRMFTTRARSVTLAWLESRFELVGQQVDVDENGAFAFGGLAPCEYRLRLVELAGSRFLPSGWDNPAWGEEGPDQIVVRAPAHGVVLEFNWTSIRFELAGDLESEDEGRLVLRTKSLYPGNERTFIPEYWSTQLPLSGDEPTFVLQAPPTKQMLGEVTFPGRQPVALDFWTPESGGEAVVRVELGRAEEAATLVIELENPQAEIPETFTVMLMRAGQADTPEVRPVEVREGRLRMEDIYPGQYRVVVCACEDPNHPGLFFRNEFDLELHPGLVTTQSIRMQQGAGLRVTLRDEEGELLSGQYEFYDHSGSPVLLVLLDSDRWKPGSDAWATTSSIGPGTHRSSGPINPGRYRLVFISPGYANRSVTVDLREGAYEDVDVSLSR